VFVAPLVQGCDCLGYIKYFDAHFTNFTGGVETIENCVCLHEEDHGILWKHHDWRTGLAEVRRSRRLTVSFICTVANYEYGFYWHFYQVNIWFTFLVLCCKAINIQPTKANNFLYEFANVCVKVAMWLLQKRTDFTKGLLIPALIL
jgi:hypothetical protein